MLTHRHLTRSMPPIKELHGNITQLKEKIKASEKSKAVMEATLEKREKENAEARDTLEASYSKCAPESLEKRLDEPGSTAGRCISHFCTSPGEDKL